MVRVAPFFLTHSIAQTLKVDKQLVMHNRSRHSCNQFGCLINSKPKHRLSVVSRANIGLPCANSRSVIEENVVYKQAIREVDLAVQPITFSLANEERFTTFVRSRC